MSNRSLAKRYARALFSIAEEENLIEQFNSELEALSDAFSQNDGELLTALTTPVFKVQERKQVAEVVAARGGRAMPWRCETDGAANIWGLCKMVLAMMGI